MRAVMSPRRLSILAAIFLAAPTGALAQAPTPAVAAPATATASAPTTSPPTPLNGIRNKLSAGDLLSAESILEVWRAQHGEDGQYLVGLSWLARGALLMDDLDKARLYVAEVRNRCADSLAHGVALDKNHDIEIALGAVIEVEAQRLSRVLGDAAAAAYLRGEIATHPGPPVAFRSRLYKRLNMLTMVGEPAPEIVAEDFVGAKPPTLASLRGKPVLLFLWAEGCGDCRAQEASLAKVKKRYAAQDLQVLAVTRYYDDPPLHATEKARVDSVWKAAYAEMGPTPIVLSTASMERYGVSSTPTFVFVDRQGIVRGYTPTRLTEPEFDKALAAILPR
jgi:cytochrome c biogenesis protein CcmG, thiol:disulfide interchange protein DsbE